MGLLIVIKVKLIHVDWLNTVVIIKGYGKKDKDALALMYTQLKAGPFLSGAP